MGNLDVPPRAPPTLPPPVEGGPRAESAGPGWVSHPIADGGAQAPLLPPRDDRGTASLFDETTPQAPPAKFQEALDHDPLVSAGKVVWSHMRGLFTAVKGSEVRDEAPVKPQNDFYYDSAAGRWRQRGTEDQEEDASEYDPMTGKKLTVATALPPPPVGRTPSQEFGPPPLGSTPSQEFGPPSAATALPPPPVGRTPSQEFGPPPVGNTPSQEIGPPPLGRIPSREFGPPSAVPVAIPGQGAVTPTAHTSRGGGGPPAQNEFYYDSVAGRWRERGAEFEEDASQYDPMTGKKLSVTPVAPPPAPPPMGISNPTSRRVYSSGSLHAHIPFGGSDAAPVSPSSSCGVVSSTFGGGAALGGQPHSSPFGTSGQPLTSPFGALGPGVGTPLTSPFGGR